MTIDALGMERQFIDHLAPVWHALRDRGRFMVEPHLLGHAQALGIDAEPCPRPVAIPRQPEPRHDGLPLLVASYGDIKVGRRLGYGPFAYLEHGAAQSYLGDPTWRSPLATSYSGGPDHEDVELYLVPNEQAAARWRAAYPQTRVEVIGSPRLAGLPDRVAGPGPVLAISFHFKTPTSLGPEAQTALGEYLPALPELAKAYAVIGHAHPKGDWPQQMERIYRRAGIPFVADFADVCRQADLYIVDNSSTLFEFASTGRPVVVLNSRWYRRDVHHGLRFWDAADVGVQVDRPADLLPAIALALEDRPTQRCNRAAALKYVYPVRRGAAKRAARAIGEWLGSREQVAA